MPKFVMLSTLGPDGAARLREDPQRLKPAYELIAGSLERALKCKVEMTVVEDTRKDARVSAEHYEKVGIRAFIAADKPLPVWAANDSNEFAGLWHRYHKRYPSYQIATESSRNWVVQAALNKGLAAYNGIAETQPSTYTLEIIEDSTDPDRMPRYDKSLPADAILSSGLTVDQLKELYE